MSRDPTHSLIGCPLPHVTGQWRRHHKSITRLALVNTLRPVRPSVRPSLGLYFTASSINPSSTGIYLYNQGGVMFIPTAWYNPQKTMCFFQYEIIINVISWFFPNPYHKATTSHITTSCTALLWIHFYLNLVIYLYLEISHHILSCISLPWCITSRIGKNNPQFREDYASPIK